VNNALSVIITSTFVFMIAGPLDAQTWPQKPIRMIVPFPPGGGNDLIGRIVAQGLTMRLGQTVIVDNRAGANGAIGLQALKQAPADGYTIGTSSDGPLTINPAIYESLPYSPQKDFAPLALAITQPLVLVVHPSMPVRSIKQLVALARANPGSVSYSSAGVGNISHLCAELLTAASATRFLHVPYKGGEAATLAVRSGEVQMMFGTVQNVVEHVRARKLIPIGTGEPAGRRLPALPDVPAIAETLAGYEARTWNGFVAPAKTSREIVERLSREIRAIVQEKDVSAQLVAIGATVAALGSEKIGALMRRDTEKWSALARSRGIRAE
jgi:tripartite-type tricarboxylate transporter receptor subunit TctC